MDTSLSLTRHLRRWILIGICSAAVVGCGGGQVPTPQPQQAASLGGPLEVPSAPEAPGDAADELGLVAELAGEEGYAMGLRVVARETGQVKGSLGAWYGARGALAERPGLDRCRALAARSAALDERLEGLSAAYERLAQLAPDRERRSVAESHRRAVALVAARARGDGSQWARWCAALQETQAVPRPRAEPPARLCEGLTLSGDVMNLHGPGLTRRISAPGGGLNVARILSRCLRDRRPTQWMYVLALVSGAPLDDLGEQASVYVHRPIDGLGGRREADLPASAVPRWPALMGVVVLPEDGLQHGPALQGLLKPYGNRLTLPGCSPQLGDRWGYADVGGQLGGGHPSSITAVGDGRYRVAPLGAGPLGLAGNGGNGVPYAPIELYLMGLLPAREVGPVQMLKGARPEGEVVAAEGVCAVDGRGLVKRFGARPPGPTTWPVGVVIVSEAPLSGEALAEHRQRVDAFTRAGQDDDPRLYNFFEATGGRARLLPVTPEIDGD